VLAIGETPVEASFFVFADARFEFGARCCCRWPCFSWPVALISISYFRWGFADAMPVRMS
jgi:hypothetical protein